MVLGDDAARVILQILDPSLRLLRACDRIRLLLIRIRFHVDPFEPIRRVDTGSVSHSAVARRKGRQSGLAADSRQPDVSPLRTDQRAAPSARLNRHQATTTAYLIHTTRLRVPTAAERAVLTADIAIMPLDRCSESHPAGGTKGETERPRRAHKIRRWDHGWAQLPTMGRLHAGRLRHL